MRGNLYLSKKRFFWFHLEQSPRVVVVERQDIREQYDLHNNGFLSLLRWMCLQWLYYSFHSLEKDCTPQQNENFIRIFNLRVWFFEDSATFDMFDEFNFICESSQTSKTPKVLLPPFSLIREMNVMRNKSISKHVRYKLKVSDKTKRCPTQDVRLN